jgi:hypothetical protein
MPISLLVPGLSGCGQEPPAEPAEQAPYHPLVSGAWWKYEHDDWTERVDVEATSFEGEPAFLMTDSPNPKDSLRSDAIVVERAGRVLRVAKDEYLIGANDQATLDSSVSYGVGFTRFDEAWAQQAVGFKETPEYTFEILSLSEQVATPLGTFDCIKIRRTKDWQAEAAGIDASDAQPKLFWFARGVGKVRELNLDTNSGELLSDYSIPE